MTDTGPRTIVLLSADESFVDRVSAALYPHFQIIHGAPEHDDIQHLIASCNPAACLIDIDGESWDRGPGVALIAQIREQWEHLPIIFATLDLSSATLVPAFRTGANDVCDKDFAPDELLAQIDRQANRHPTRMGHEAASLTVFVGAREGQGTTTAALATAQDLARRGSTDKRVLLLDFSHPPAVVPDLVGQRANYFMTDAVHDLPRLDDTMIEGAILRAPPGNLFVLPLATTDRGVTSVGPEELLKLVTVLRSYFFRVLVDISWPWRTQIAERLFISAETRFLCVVQSVTSIHAASTFLGQLRETSAADVPYHLVVTRYDSGIIPSVLDIKKALGTNDAPLVVPESRREIDLARNAADPLVRGTAQSSFEKSISRLVEKIARDEAEMLVPRTGWRRFFTRLERARGNPVTTS